MFKPIAFGNAEAVQAPQQVAAPEQPVTEQQPVAEQPLPQAPAQDTFTPEKAQETPPADPNDQFVKAADQPAEQAK